MRRTRRGASKRLSRQRPFQLLGLISYSFYLWHWPILIIATQHRGVTSLPVWDNVGLLLVATVVAALTYRLLENPVRHSTRLRRRRWASLAFWAYASSAQRSSSRPMSSAGRRWISGLWRQSKRAPLALHPRRVQSRLCGPRTPPAVRIRRTNPTRRPQTVLLIGDSTSCTLLPGLQAVGPSYGMKFENGAVVGCGVVSGTLAPTYSFGVEA